VERRGGEWLLMACFLSPLTGNTVGKNAIGESFFKLQRFDRLIIQVTPFKFSKDYLFWQERNKRPSVYADGLLIK